MASTKRSPYTDAADIIRGVAGYNDTGTKISRSDASQILHMIADATGINPDDLAKTLAEYKQRHDEAGGHPIEVMNINYWKMKMTA